MIINNVNMNLSDLNSDQTIVNGVLGLVCNEYISKEDNVGRPLSGLDIVSIQNKERPIFHSSTQIYGFLTLQAGMHKLYITDPRAFFLPRTVTVDVPPYDNRVLLNRLNTNLNNPQNTKYLHVNIYPSIEYPLLNGETSIWGTIVDAEDNPCAFCRLQMETVRKGQPNEVNTYSDINGVYLIRLMGEKTEFQSPDDGDLVLDDGILKDDFKRKLRVYKLKKDPRFQKKPLSFFPDNFDDLPDENDPENPYKEFSFEQLGHLPDADQVKVKVGHKTRRDIKLIGEV